MKHRLEAAYAPLALVTTFSFGLCRRSPSGIRDKTGTTTLEGGGSAQLMGFSILSRAPEDVLQPDAFEHTHVAPNPDSLKGADATLKRLVQNATWKHALRVVHTWGVRP